MKRTRDSDGFTLLEMVIVVTIISILATILTPIFSGYVERARHNVARVDLMTITAAVIQYHTDTRVWPIYQSKSEIPNGDVFNVLKSPGNSPDVAAGILDWPIMIGAVNGTSNLDGMLNTNFLGFSTIGARAWKGAYLELGPDPWGGSYYLTAANLRPDSLNAAYIISAGPNQTLDTLYTQSHAAPLVVGVDDLVLRIR